MTGRELSEHLTYTGMEIAVRKLAIREHPDKIEKIAIMSELEVCNLIAEDYEILYAKDEEVGLVKKDDLDKCFELIHMIKR